jgi:UPF0271 protein
MDLNADLGESWERWRSGEDIALLDVVTSANVCCGAYAGDADLMLATCEAAVERGVAIGAQVGYPDREGFGRVALDLDDAALIETVRAQIDALAAEADAAGGSLSYVKPHGALYNTIVSDQRQAAAVVEAVIAYGLPLLGLPGSALLRLAAAEGLPVVPEGFADRVYASDVTLVPRSEPGAVLESAVEAATQTVSLIGRVESICVHSDSPGALETARAVRTALERAGVTLTGLHA